MNYTFESIAGYKREKEELRGLCEILRNRERYEEMGAKLPKGVIFYGPSGTGKTLFAKVMANMCGLDLLEIDVTRSTDGLAVIRRLDIAFEKASKQEKPCMIFFDEIDKFLPNSDEEYCTDNSKQMLAALLTLIDGMNSTGRVVFVATCNCYGTLPSALVRSGRIDRKFGLSLPSDLSRREILKMYMKKTSCRFGMTAEAIARTSAGMSGADLETLINECILHYGTEKYISEQNILLKLEEIKSEGLPKKNPPKTDRILACQNLGHFVVAKTYDDGGYLLDLDTEQVCNNFFSRLLSEFDGDYSYREDTEDEDSYMDEEGDEEAPTVYYSYSDLCHAITVLWGGYCACKVILGESYDNQYSNMRVMELILGRMSETGMLGIERMFFDERRANGLTYPAERIARIDAEFDRIKSVCLRKAEELVRANAELIRAMIPILLERRSMTEEVCEPILRELGGLRCTEEGGEP